MYTIITLKRTRRESNPDRLNGSTNVPTNLGTMTWCPKTKANTHIYPYDLINTTKVTSTYPQLLKCLFPKGESSLDTMALCPVGSGSLSRRTDTLFTPAPLKEAGVHIYLSMGYFLGEVTIGILENHVRLKKIGSI